MTTHAEPRAQGFGEFFLSCDQGFSEHPFDALTVLVLAYVALPMLCFLFGWIVWPLALISSLAFLWAVRRFCLDFGISVVGLRLRLVHLVVLSIAILWCLFGGAGHYSYANPDWTVRDAVYGDLILSDWPPAYNISPDGSLVLRSAIGYFLLPALLSSRLGMASADILLFGWTVIGVGLFLALLPIHTGNWRKRATAFLVIVLFSGMDIVGILVTTGMLPIFPLRLEWWTAFSYSSMSGQLFWAPNHTLPLWLGSALLYRHWARPGFVRLALLFGPCTLIWSPFVVIALLPFLLFAVLRQYREGWQWPPAREWLVSLVLGLIATAFLTLDAKGISTAAGTEHMASRFDFWPAYLVFVVTEFATLALLVLVRARHSRGLLCLSTAILFVLPAFHFGPSNDQLLRCSVPPLVFILIGVLVLLRDHPGGPGPGSRPPWLILIVLLLGAATPFCEAARAVLWPSSAPDYTKTLADTQDAGLPAHYVGHLQHDQNLAKLIRKPALVPTGSQRRAVMDGALR